MSVIAEAERLRPFIAAIFEAAGSSGREAAQIAEHLVEANLCGHDSHGVGMVPAYMLHLKKGWVRANQEPQRLGGAGPFAIFDGQMGYGQPIVNAVMEQAASIVREQGVAVVTLRNAQHIGRVGFYAERLSAQGLMSIHFVNAVYAVPSVAPFLGSQARLMTNPVCVAIPGAHPLLMDFATSTIALGKVRVAYNKGEQVASGRLIDHVGQPTNDPAVMFEEPKGAQTAFGEHKGWALAFIAEVLGGAMSGGERSGEGFASGLTNGMMSIVLEPGRLIDAGWLDEAVGRLVDYVKSSPPADPDQPVLVPGEPERAARAQREREGIPIDSTTWRQICDCAQARGVDVPTFASDAN